MFVPIHIA